MRLIDSNGKSVGVVPIADALQRARQEDLDLIEVTAKARPPVVRIADQGKYQYEQNKQKKKWADEDREKGKKKREILKQLQIKPGTDAGILALRAKKIREWLDGESRVQIDLFLFGRYRSMDEVFLKKRLIDFIESIPGEVHISEEVRKSPKGFAVTLAPAKKK